MPEVSPAPRPNSQLERIACALTAAFILAYAGLIGLGRWQLDEFYYFYWMRQGASFEVERLKWSPRPLSEFIYFIYGWLVNHLHQPFILELLAGCWAVFFVAGLLTYWQNRRLPHLLVALSVMALFLCGGHTTEVFYWPAGAIAYLPTLAATLLLFLQVIDRRLLTPQGQTTAAICLLVAAASSEAGATFVICYALMQLFSASSRKTPQWWLLPAALALLVLMAVRLNRFGATAPVTGKPLIPSFIAGAQEIVIEIIGREMLANTIKNHPDVHTWLHSGLQIPVDMLLGARLWMEIFLAAGIVLLWSRLAPTSKALATQILQLVCALLLASFLTVVAANLNFGETCCSRHELLRECWMVLSITGLAIAACAWLPIHRLKQWSSYSAVAPLLLCLAVLSLGHLRPLWNTYRMYGELRNAAQRNYESGFQKDRPQMTFAVLPSAGIISQEIIAPGAYTASPLKPTDFGLPTYPQYLMGFFEKQTVVIQPLPMGLSDRNTAANCGDIFLPKPALCK